MNEGLSLPGKPDMVVTGGENVYPAEVENVLYSCSAVQECSAVGVEDEQRGLVVHAVVVVREGHELTAEQVISHCRHSLAGYKCPRRVTFVDALPKTVVGKNSRKEIKNLL